jgi:hypothetical protein
MEYVNQSLGYILYTATLAPSTIAQTFDIGRARDRVHVYVDRMRVATFEVRQLLVLRYLT